MKTLLKLAAILALVAFGIAQNNNRAELQSPAIQARTSHDQVLETAFAQHQSGIRIQNTGVVTRLLADDLDGKRHQRFIVQVDSGQTLLIAHNIDIAARINSLKVGDRVEFVGEYEWNPKGGVIHWTHHDPAGRHASGWIRHNGRVYR